MEVVASQLAGAETEKEFSDTNLRLKIGRNFASVLTECFSANLKLVSEH